jgi:hypothetical protein
MKQELLFFFFLEKNIENCYEHFCSVKINVTVATSRKRHSEPYIISDIFVRIVFIPLLLLLLLLLLVVVVVVVVVVCLRLLSAFVIGLSLSFN